MSEEEHDRREQTSVEQSFSKVLNRHGFPFQYAVLNYIRGLCERRATKWVFEASEFPVCVRGQDTRIDFILKHASGWYMVAECKRADPKFSNWCFVRAPFVRRNQSVEQLVVDRLEMGHGGPGVQGVGVDSIMGDVAYHIGLPAKTRGNDGESPGSRNAIEEAAGQVCRGVNGLIELLLSKPQDLVKSTLFLLPVVFTTAKLWVSDCDLASACLEDGSIEVANGDLVKRPWVCFQYHVSASLKHSRELLQRPSELADVLSCYYARTILIVNASGIRSFLLTVDPNRF